MILRGISEELAKDIAEDAAGRSLVWSNGRAYPLDVDKPWEIMNQQQEADSLSAKIIFLSAIENKLLEVEAAVKKYYLALDKREHGGIAQDRAFNEIQLALGMHWQQGEALKEFAQNHEEDAHKEIMPKAQTMIINFKNRCLWHSDCENHFGGIMKEIRHEEDKTLMECLHCGKKGYYPKGGIGRICVEIITEE